MPLPKATRANVFLILTLVGFALVLLGALTLRTLRSKLTTQQAKANSSPANTAAPSMPTTVSSITREASNETTAVAQISQPHIRPASGSYISAPQGPKGRGQLRVVNPSAYDIAVKLVETGSMQTRRFFYVQASSEATVKNIGPEVCYLFISKGLNWDSNSQKFLQDQSFTKIAEYLDFSRIPRQTIILKPVLGGELHSVSIDEDEFIKK
ncbi:MAG TPA: hypothetical protein VF525_15105 [Pyrinomonadaceae bacterium]